MGQPAWLSGPREDADLLRHLLNEEIAARRAASDQGAGETLLTLSALLLACGAAHDARLFWHAKTANFDTWAGGYDLEFVLALGDPEATRQAVIARGGTQVASLQTLDLAALVAEIPAWRSTLGERVPRDLAGLSLAAALDIAELFDDHEAVERLGCAATRGPEDLARLYRRLGKPASALLHFRAVAATTTPSGAQIFALAQVWRAELTWFPLAGLEAASRAARKWGRPEEQSELEAALRRERAALAAR